MEPLRLTEVGKRYGRSGPWVLSGVDLVVEPGALVRIEGANGSGKSTLLKLVAGIEPPTRGRLRFAGRRAYVPERFPPALPFGPADYLRHLGRIHGLSAVAAAERTEFWLDRFGIADRAGTPLSRLSKGTCQKVAVAQALLPEAELLLLDEAWTGLDQAARTTLDRAAAERAEAGGTVLFVDHDPNRLAGLTSRALRVQGGRLAEVRPRRTEAPRELMGILVAADELPDPLPGAPARVDRPDARACLVAAAGAARVQLASLAAAVGAGLVLAVLEVGTVWLVCGRTTIVLGREVPWAHAALAGLLAALCCVLVGLAVGALSHRPVLLRGSYGILAALGLSVPALVVPFSPANAAVRALVTGSLRVEVCYPLAAPALGALLALLVAAGTAALAGRRTE